MFTTTNLIIAGIAAVMYFLVTRKQPVVPPVVPVPAPVVPVLPGPLAPLFPNLPQVPPDLLDLLLKLAPYLLPLVMEQKKVEAKNLLQELFVHDVPMKTEEKKV